LWRIINVFLRQPPPIPITRRGRPLQAAPGSKRSAKGPEINRMLRGREKQKKYASTVGRVMFTIATPEISCVFASQQKLSNQ